MIEYRKGNLLQTNIQNILHGCNCRGVMGSGVAKLIRDKYPKAYQDYKDVYDNNGLDLGSIILSPQPNGKTVINALTQENYGPGVQVSYWAVANVFLKLNTVFQKDQKVAMPMIGAGLAGGDWNVIEAIIENTAKTYRPIVYQL